MAYSKLPPQAYTKDQLAEAYAWLMEQPENLKGYATDADTLISLYQKSKRDNAGFEASVENFKSELKSLAGMVDSFDSDQAKLQQEQQAQVSEPEAKRVVYASPKAAHAQPSAPAQSTQPQAPQQQQAVTTQAAKPAGTSIQGLDAKSQALLIETKNLLNLSSEEEALRVVIKMGFEKRKSRLSDA